MPDRTGTACCAPTNTSGLYTLLESRFQPSTCRSCVVLFEFTQEAFPVRNLCSKIVGDSLAHVRQSLADAQIQGCAGSRRVRQDRDVFARVIRRWPAGIGVAAVVRGDDE